MSETEKQALLAATKRAMEQFRSLPLEEKLEELKRIGILDEQGQLSERYGGPGEHTELPNEETAPEQSSPR